MRSTVILAAAAIAATAAPALGQGLLDSYCARLGSADHFNSNGLRLTDVAAIIRQDRANYHAFGVRDPEDMDDAFFRSRENRARLETMLRNGTVTGAARRAIVDGTPLVCVEVYGDFVNVDVR